MNETDVVYLVSAIKEIGKRMAITVAAAMVYSSPRGLTFSESCSIAEDLYRESGPQIEGQRGGGEGEGA